MCLDKRWKAWLSEKLYSQHEEEDIKREKEGDRTEESIYRPTHQQVACHPNGRPRTKRITWRASTGSTCE